VTLGGVAHDVRWERRRLPARPMLRRELDAGAMSASGLDAAVRRAIAEAAHDAVLSIRVAGALTPAHSRAISAARVRALTPPTMNVEVVPVDGYVSSERVSIRGAERSVAAQLSLY